MYYVLLCGPYVQGGTPAQIAAQRSPATATARRDGGDERRGAAAPAGDGPAGGRRARAGGGFGASGRAGPGWGGLGTWC